MIFSATTALYVGNTSYSKAYIGSTLVWPSDPYPEVEWPYPFFKPKYYETWDEKGVQLFVTQNGFSLPYRWAYGGDCELEGGLDKGYKIYNSGETKYSGSYYSFSVLNFTGGTTNTWFAVYEVYDLYLNSGGTLIQGNDPLGIFINGSNGECGGKIFFQGDFVNVLSGVTMVGGNNEEDLKNLSAFTSQMYLFCLNGSGGTINLTHSTAWTSDSMKFTVKNSPNVVFSVIDNSYWRGIIPWEMAEYYNVTFIDENGEIIQKETYKDKFFTIEATGSGVIALITANGGGNIFYRVNQGSWTQTTVKAGFTIQVSTGDKVELYGQSGTNIKSGTANSGPFSGTTAPVIIYGNMGSLKNVNFSTASSFSVGSWSWQRIFGKMTTLTDASNLYFPDNMNFNSYACEYMFDGCDNLTKAPTVMTRDGQVLSTRCFDYAFINCTSLKTGPSLLKKDVTVNAYRNMFSGCTGLEYVKCLMSSPSTSLTENWLAGVPATGTFVKKSGVTWPTGASGIPSGWTVQEV